VTVCERLEKLGISIAHYDLRFVKPLDEKMLNEVFRKFKKIITVEDGCILGGFGSAVIEFMVDNNYRAELKRLGIPDAVIEHGEQIELHRECKFDVDGIEKAALSLLEPAKSTV
jgi:1-deoxy-D-xylulose-5-phosphate synthase